MASFCQDGTKIIHDGKTQKSIGQHSAQQLLYNSVGHSRDIWNPGDSAPLLNHYKRGIPGVSEERWFHNHYPDIHLNNDLLRKVMREDYLETDQTQLRGDVTQLASQLVLGYARGDHYCLYEVLVSVLRSQPDKLNVASLIRQKSLLREAESEIITETLSIESSTTISLNLDSSISEVYACQGPPTSMFAICFANKVQCISLEVDQGLQNSVIRSSRVFEADDGKLWGRSPVACIYTYTGRWTLYVLTDDNVLRLWHTDMQLATSNPRSTYELVSSIRVTTHGQIARHISLPSHSTAELFVVLKQQLMLADTSSRTIQTVFHGRLDEEILMMESIQSETPAARGFCCLLTTRRVILVEKVHERFVTKAVWHHRFRLGVHFSLRLLSLHTLLVIVITIGEGPLCIVFVSDFAEDQICSFFPARLPLETKHDITAILPYIVQATSILDRWKVSLGVLYMDDCITLNSALFSTEAEFSMIEGQSQEPKGPRYVPDEIAEVSQQDSAQRFAISLRAFYGTAIHHMSVHRHSVSIDYLKGIDPDSGKGYVQLGCDLLANVECLPFESFDNHVEAITRQWSQNGFVVGESYGLRLHQSMLDCGDPETTSASSIKHTLHSRYGHSHVSRDADTNSQVEKCAMSLSMSTLTVRSAAMNNSEMLSSQLHVSQRGNSTADALEAILSEWDTECEPASYVWGNLDSQQGQVTTQQFTVPDIPAFKAQAPPIVTSSQALPPQISHSSQVVQSSQDSSQYFPATQPLPGRFGDRKTKRKKKAGFR